MYKYFYFAIVIKKAIRKFKKNELYNTFTRQNCLSKITLQIDIWSNIFCKNVVTRQKK